MKLGRLLILFGVISVTCINLFATAQYPDKIIYQGKEYSLHSNPMEDYFAKNPAKKPKGGIVSSALWRGYVATFEFNDKTLVLKDIQIMVNLKNDGKSYERGWKSVISEVVPENEKLKIDWFTGILVLPYGELVNYVHMGYGSTYQNYILLETDKGILGKSKEFDYREYEKFKQRQFEAFRQTEDYKKLVKELKKERGTDDKYIDSFLKDFIISYTSKILVD